MLRKLSAILLLCIGLLAIAGPAAGCVLAAANADCCPAGGAPCGDENGAGATLATDASACCLTSSTSPGVTAELSRVRAPEPQAVSPDPQLSLAWLLTWQAPQSIQISTSQFAYRLSVDASLTYLHTLRLRL